MITFYIKIRYPKYHINFFSKSILKLKTPIRTAQIIITLQQYRCNIAAMLLQLLYYRDTVKYFYIKFCPMIFHQIAALQSKTKILQKISIFNFMEFRNKISLINFI